MPDAPDFFTAYDDVLAPLLAADGFLAVLTGAERAGLLAALREPRTREDLAVITGMPLGRLGTICEVLALHDVLETDAGRHVLTPSWLTLTGPAAFITLADSLASSRIEGRLLQGLGSGEDYWSLPVADRLTFARAISPNPHAPGLVEAFRHAAAGDPDNDALRAGGRSLELGCGVAGRILMMLQAVPEMTATGVELAEDLADEARRRAELLGVADRFEVVCADAATFHRPDSFVSGTWSQFFFPEESRAPALATLRASVRSGAPVFAPLLGDGAAVAADPKGVEARGRAVFRVILGAWGVPDRTPDELVAEFTDAGFADARVVDAGGLPRVRAVRP
jgi:hypothetical protein